MQGVVNVRPPGLVQPASLLELAHKAINKYKKIFFVHN